MSAREQELLQALEAIRRRKERLTIAEFLRRMGYKSKTALRHFPALREELHRYCGTGLGRRHLEGPSAERALRTKLEGRQAEIARLRAAVERLEPLAAELRSQAEARRAAEAERDQLRGMVSALVAQIAQTSVVRARGIEEDLLRAARPLVPGLPDAVPEGTAPAGAGPQTSTRLLPFPEQPEGPR